MLREEGIQRDKETKTKTLMSGRKINPLPGAHALARNRTATQIAWEWNQEPFGVWRKLQPTETPCLGLQFLFTQYFSIKTYSNAM